MTQQFTASPVEIQSSAKSSDRPGHRQALAFCRRSLTATMARAAEPCEPAGTTEARGDRNLFPEDLSPAHRRAIMLLAVKPFVRWPNATSFAQRGLPRGGVRYRISAGLAAQLIGSQLARLDKGRLTVTDAGRAMVKRIAKAERRLKGRAKAQAAQVAT